jgi:hypothetical protein
LFDFRTNIGIIVRKSNVRCSAMAKPNLLSEAEFEALKPKLIKRLTEALEKELADCALPELGADPNSDLWDLPTVDSKTVAKLSPVVKDLIGRRLHPNWIRKGGYDSVGQAIEDLIAQIRTNCVLGGAAASAAKSHSASVTT